MDRIHIFRQGKRLTYNLDHSRNTSHPNYTSASLRLSELRREMRLHKKDWKLELTEYGGVYFVKCYVRVK